MKRMMKRCFALLAVLAVSSLLGTSVFAQGATYGPFCYGETVVLDHAANPNIPIFYDPNTRQPVVPEITFGGTDFVLDHSTNRYKKEIFEYLLDKDATAPFYFRITWYLEPTTKDIVVCNSSTGTIIVCGDSEGEITVNEETKQLTWRGLTIDATKSGSYPLKAAAGPTGVETECTIATLNVRSITPTYFKDTAITICRRDAEEAMNWFDQFHWSWYETGPNGEQIKHDETTEYQQGLEREATHTYSLKSRVCPECDSIIGNVTITKIIKAPMIQRHYWISYDEDKFYFPSNGQYYDYKYDPVYPNNATEEMVEIYYTGKDGVECPDSSFFLYIHRHKEPVTDTKDTFMCKDGPGFVWKPNEQNDYTETIPGDKEGTYRCTIPTFDDMCDSLIYILNTHIIEKRAGQQILYHTACTPNNTYEYTWPDGVTQTFTFNTALDYEFEHTIKSKRCPVCDSVDCLLKLHYSPGGHREPYITKLYICYDSTSVAFPPMQRSYTEGTHYPQYIFSDGRRGGEEEKDAWGVCHDSVFW